jgi:hypothetical protein
MEVSYEHNSETSGNKKHGKFLDELSELPASREGLYLIQLGFVMYSSDFRDLDRSC